MALDQGLVARVRDAMTETALQRGLALREKHMFGGLAFLLDDKMACGVINDDRMVSVGPAAYEEALAHQHARPMDFTDRPMRGHVFIGPRGCHTQTSVGYWVDRAATNILSLISQELGEEKLARTPRCRALTANGPVDLRGLHSPVDGTAYGETNRDRTASSVEFRLSRKGIVCELGVPPKKSVESTLLLAQDTIYNFNEPVSGDNIFIRG